MKEGMRKFIDSKLYECKYSKGDVVLLEYVGVERKQIHNRLPFRISNIDALCLSPREKSKMRVSSKKRCAHEVSEHLKMQPCGPGRKERKLIVVDAFRRGFGRSKKSK